MSFRRARFAAVGGFDERFDFGAEEQDLCRRVTASGEGSLVLEPGARVTHHFEGTVRDTVRRARVYGGGSARLFHRWSGGPTVFPMPLLVAAIALLSLRRPWVAAVGLLAPHLLFPRGALAAVSQREPSPLLDAYVRVGQEAVENVGLVEGLWRYRHLRGGDPA
jgi:hypothetical protein